MVNFYMSIIFLGITLIVLSLIWILIDRKKSGDYTRELEEKKEELVKIISDSEQMIDELNKFSDYIVTQISTKHEELSSTLENLDNKIHSAVGSKVMSQAVQEIKETNEERTASKKAEVENNSLRSAKYATENKGNVIDFQLGDDSDYADLIFNLNLDNEEKNSNDILDNTNIIQEPKSKDKIIPIYSKYKEVMRLSESGLSDSDIAKALNIGKGEIKLILGMNSSKEKIGIR